MTRSYCPSNGTEGMEFTSRFCDRCKREAGYRETDDPAKSCPIQTDAMLYDVGDPDYPAEWIVEDDGTNPRCTAFEPEAVP